MGWVNPESETEDAAHGGLNTYRQGQSGGWRTNLRTLQGSRGRSRPVVSVSGPMEGGLISYRPGRLFRYPETVKRLSTDTRKRL